MPKVKLKLIKDARNAGKFWSVKAGVAAAIITAQEVLPIWEQFVPDNTFAIIGAAVATGAVFLRVLDQGLDPEEVENNK